MHIARRKKTYCQNCQYPLLENYNFCPNCGQENSDKLVSFGTLMGEFFSNYIAYDSRLVRTIRPFLFKPGYLTNEFIAGRRTKYMHPLRLYFIISFFYFLILSFLVSQDNTPIKVPDANNPSLNADSLQTEIMKDVSGSLEDSGINADSLNRATREAIDGIEIDITDDGDSTSGEETEKFVGKISKITQLIKKGGITADQVLDSAGVKKNFIKLRLVNQAIKLNQQGSGAFLNYFISKVSIMMFVILPILALLLKLFYVRRKRYYVEHMTFTLNIHSFMFLLFSIAFLIMEFTDSDGLIGWSVFLILVLYIILSFKRVYKQSWTKTMFKLFLLFISYIFTLSVSLILTIVISVLLF